MTNHTAEPRVSYVIFYVADVSKTVAFWCEAFGFSLKFMHESQAYAELRTGQTTVAFASEELIEQQGIRTRRNRLNDEPAGAELGLTTDDPEALFARAVKSGATAVKPIETKPWGQRSGFVRDLNGVLVELCTPMD